MYLYMCRVSQILSRSRVNFFATGRPWNFSRGSCLGEIMNEWLNKEWFWPFNPFAMLKRTFYICVIWHDIWVVTQSMNLTETKEIAKYDVCLAWLHENCCLVRGMTFTNFRQVYQYWMYCNLFILFFLFMFLLLAPFLWEFFQFNFW